jgi:hypothetical protein
MVRCGRYTYHEVVIHTTNPAHLVPRTPSPTTAPPLRIAARYAELAKPVGHDQTAATEE